MLARRFGRGGGRERGARLRAVVLILLASAALLVAGRAWAHPSSLWLVVRALVYASGLVALGLSLGSDPLSPEAAFRRAVRGFALLAAVLLVAGLAGATPSWAPWAVVAALVVGGLLVAVVRYESLTDLVDPVERLPAWPWLLAVAGAVLVVIAVGALLSQVLRANVLLLGLDVVAAVLRFALAGVAYLIGYAGAGLVRGLAWLLGAVHLHSFQPIQRPRALSAPVALRHLNPRHLRLWSGSRLLFTAFAALGALGLAFALVAVALRRFRRHAVRGGHGRGRARGARLAPVGRRGVRRGAGAAAAPPPAGAPPRPAFARRACPVVATPNWNSGWRVAAGRGRPAPPCATTWRRPRRPPSTPAADRWKATNRPPSSPPSTSWRATRITRSTLRRRAASRRWRECSECRLVAASSGVKGGADARACHAGLGLAGAHAGRPPELPPRGGLPISAGRAAGRTRPARRRPSPSWPGVGDGAHGASVAMSARSCSSAG